MKYLRLYEQIDFNDIDNIDDADNCWSDFGDHEDFKDFLIKNDVLDEFLENMINSNIEWRKKEWKDYLYNPNGYCLKDYLDNTKPISYVQNSFIWKLTPQGHKYWDYLDDLWLSIAR
jgi:hypothetical protein